MHSCVALWVQCYMRYTQVTYMCLNHFLVGICYIDTPQVREGRTQPLAYWTQIFLYDFGSEDVRVTFKSGAIRAQLGSETQLSYSISGNTLDKNTFHHHALTRDGSGYVRLYHILVEIISRVLYTSSLYLFHNVLIYFECDK